MDAAETVTVFTDVPAVAKAFDYSLPERFTGPTSPGSRVRVPFHGRSVTGWILGPGQEANRAVKEVKSSLGVGPSTPVLATCAWASRRWAGPQARFLKSASPDTIVKALPQPPTLVLPPGEKTDLDQIGLTAGQTPGPTLVRLGPATDPFALVMGFLHGATDNAAHASVIVLVPGKGYAKRLVARFAKRGVAAIDANNDWAAARAGWPVIVGTRLGVLGGGDDLAGIVVLDAEDDRYYSEATPTWNAIDIARHRCGDRIPLFMTSATPDARLSFDATLLPLEQQRATDGWPTVHLIDQKIEDPQKGLMTPSLVEATRAALDEQPDGLAVAFLLNRKGRARLVVCARCDDVARCQRCDAACALNDTLDCPRCGASRPVICTGCGATAMKLLRLGTSQLTVECGALFREPTVELTAKSDPSELRGARIVVGTEAVLHRIRSLRLIAFLDLDHHLLAPVAGAEIRALSLIGRAGRLVGGRGDLGSGSVIVQTRLEEHPVVLAAQSGDPTAVLEADGAMRKLLNLAPFGAVARITGAGAKPYGDALKAAGLTISMMSDDELLANAVDAERLSDALASTPRPKEGVKVAVDPVTI